MTQQPYGYVDGGVVATKSNILHTIIEAPHNVGAQYEIHPGDTVKGLPSSGMGFPSVDVRGLSPISAKLIERDAPIIPVPSVTSGTASGTLAARLTSGLQMTSGAATLPSEDSFPKPSPVAEANLTMTSAVSTKPNGETTDDLLKRVDKALEEEDDASLQPGQTAKETNQSQSGSPPRQPPVSLLASSPTASPSPTRVIGVSYTPSVSTVLAAPTLRTPSTSPVVVRYPASQSVPAARVVQRVVNPTTPQTVTRAVAPPAFFPQPHPTTPVYLPSQAQLPQQMYHPQQFYQQALAMYHPVPPAQPQQVIQVFISRAQIFYDDTFYEFL